jgi:hypothetical protein
VLSPASLEGEALKRIPKAIYQSVDDIDHRIRNLEDRALRLRADQAGHRSIMHEINRLRILVDAKRWLAGAARKSSVRRAA